MKELKLRPKCKGCGSRACTIGPRCGSKQLKWYPRSSRRKGTGYNQVYDGKRQAKQSE